MEELYAGYPVKRKYKYLGIVIDDRLNFKSHIESLERKITKGLKIT
jgi:hypothetical protein